PAASPTNASRSANAAGRCASRRTVGSVGIPAAAVASGVATGITIASSPTRPDHRTGSAASSSSAESETRCRVLPAQARTSCDGHAAVANRLDDPKAATAPAVGCEVDRAAPCARPAVEACVDTTPAEGRAAWLVLVELVAQPSTVPDPTAEA